MTDEMIFNGPAEFNMEVFITNDETAVSARVSIGLGVFEYPTKEKVKERIANFEKGELIDNPALSGFRVMTKEEAWSMVMYEKTGTQFAMVGGKDWDDIN